MQYLMVSYNYTCTTIYSNLFFVIGCDANIFQETNVSTLKMKDVMEINNKIKKKISGQNESLNGNLISFYSKSSRESNASKRASYTFLVFSFTYHLFFLFRFQEFPRGHPGRFIQ